MTWAWGLGRVLAVWSVVLFACSNTASDPLVVVSVSGLPRTAVYLQVAASLDDVVSEETLKLDLRGWHGQAYTFALRLSAAKNGGSLLVLLEGIDAQGCLLSVASASGTVEPFSEVAAHKLEATMTEFPPPNCSTNRPILRPLASSSTTTATNLAGQPLRITLDGWGFWPKSSVELDGQPLTEITWESPQRMSVVPPPRRGQLGSATLTLISPSGLRASTPFQYSSYGDVKLERSTLAVPDLYSVKVRDLDQDGFDDLIAFSRLGGSRTLRVFMNDKGGGFSMPPLTLDLDSTVMDFLIGDVTDDSRLDLIGVGATTTLPPFAQLFVYPGAAPASFRPPVLMQTDIHTIAGAAMADLEVSASDHQPELVVWKDSSVCVLKKMNATSFTSAQCWSDPDLAFQTVLPIPFDERIAIADLNIDKYPDIMLRNRIFFIQGTNLMNKCVNYTIVDYNFDGLADIRCQVSGLISTFSTKPSLLAPQRWAEFGRKTFYQAGDLNGDAIGDLFLITEKTLTLNTGEVSLGGTRNVSLDEVPECWLPFGGDSWKMLPYDINNDGKGDLIIADMCKSEIKIYINKSE